MPARIYRKLVRKLRSKAQEESLLLRVEAGYKPRLGWHDQIACSHTPTDHFYEKAKLGALVCAACPVRQDCLANICATEQQLPINYVVGYVAVSDTARTEYRKAHPNDNLQPLPDNQRTRRGHAC